MQKLTKISYFASCQQYFANLVNGETHRLIIHTQPSLFISRCQLKAIKFRKFYLYLLADTLLSPFHAHLCWLPTLKCQLTASTATFLNIFFLWFFFCFWSLYSSQVVAKAFTATLLGVWRLVYGWVCIYTEYLFVSVCMYLCFSHSWISYIWRSCVPPATLPRYFIPNHSLSSVRAFVWHALSHTYSLVKFQTIATSVYYPSLICLPFLFTSQAFL